MLAQQDARERYCFIRDCRLDGLTWQKVAYGLGITQQSAREWYRRFENGAENMANKAKQSQGIRSIAAQLRRDIQTAGFPKASGVPWPEDLRTRIVAYSDAVGSVNKAASELGVNGPTITGWIKYKRVKRAPAMRVSAAVEKQASAPQVATPNSKEANLSTAETATIVGPGGFRVEGLSLRNAAELLKHLES